MLGDVNGSRVSRRYTARLRGFSVPHSGRVVGWARIRVLGQEGRSLFPRTKKFNGRIIDPNLIVDASEFRSRKTNRQDAWFLCLSLRASLALTF